MLVMNQLLKILNAELDAQVVTVAQLASRLGCSRQHIYNIANGDTKATMDFAERLATELGLTIKLSARSTSRKIPA